MEYKFTFTHNATNWFLQDKPIGMVIWVEPEIWLEDGYSNTIATTENFFAALMQTFLDI